MLGQAQRPHTLGKAALQRPRMEVIATIATGKQVGRRPIALPVGPQLRQQHRRQRYEPILLPLALAHLHDHAGTVDVRDTQMHDFADAQAASVGHANQRTQPVVRQGVEDLLHLAAAE